VIKVISFYFKSVKLKLKISNIYDPTKQTKLKIKIKKFCRSHQLDSAGATDWILQEPPIGFCRSHQLASAGATNWLLQIPPIQRLPGNILSEEYSFLSYRNLQHTMMVHIAIMVCSKGITSGGALARGSRWPGRVRCPRMRFPRKEVRCPGNWLFGSGNCLFAQGRGWWLGAQG